MSVGKCQCPVEWTHKVALQLIELRVTRVNNVYIGHKHTMYREQTTNRVTW